MFKKCIERTTLSYDELQTLLMEVETVVNCWPLTYVEDNHDGVTYSLSPLHLIHGRCITSTANGGHFEVVSTNASNTKSQAPLSSSPSVYYPVEKNVPNKFTRKLCLKSTTCRGPGIAVGDIVILKSDSSNRMFWNLAKVEELLPGRDGLVGAAIVKVTNSDKRPHLMRRSVKHLYPIEVNAKDDEPIGKIVDTPSLGSTTPNSRPRRNAAVVADIL